MREIMERMTYLTPLALASVKKVGAWLLVGLASFFTPIKPLLIGVMILVAIDWHTGKTASKKRGEKIVSKKLMNTAVKLKNYFLFICSANLLTVFFFRESGIEFAGLAAGYIAYIEFKSFTENMKDITGNDMWDKLFEFMPNINLFRKEKNGES